MAHKDRLRYVEPHLKEALSFSALVGLIGQRQTGKTTLVEKITKNNSYVTMDASDSIKHATAEPALFIRRLLEHSLPVGIDECQKAPPLFSELKLHVQKNHRPGQFLLTGSIRFTSRKAIQESLTGRIHTIEMLPFNIPETSRQPLNDIILIFSRGIDYWKTHSKNRKTLQSWKAVNQFLEAGGLPGILFLRNKKHRNGKFNTHIETLLQRDIKLIINTTVPYENLRSLITYLAAHQGESFNATEAGRECQISQNTLKKILFAFESMFLIRRLVPFGDVSTPRFYFEDQGTASYLSHFTERKDLERFLFSHLFASVHYHHMNTYKMGFYSSRGGADIEFVFEVNKQMYGFILSQTEKASLSVLRSSESFLRAHPKAKVLVLSTSGEFEQISKNIAQVPFLSLI